MRWIWHSEARKGKARQPGAGMMGHGKARHSRQGAASPDGRVQRHRWPSTFQYVLDPLREMDTEQVALAFTATNKAITLSAEPERHHFHIIMPMQVG